MEGEGLTPANTGSDQPPGGPEVTASGADRPPGKPGVTSSGFKKDHDQANVIRRYPHVHAGKGAIDVKFFFRGEMAAAPALFLIYTIPPGTSEGVHTHHVGDKEQGSFDEFYYIISGSGEMEIDGEKVPVSAGDHVMTPNGVAHGIENTSSQDDLKVYLLAMMRD